MYNYSSSSVIFFIDLAVVDRLLNRLLVVMPCRRIALYCDMMPKIQNYVVKEVLWRHPLLHSGLLKGISAAVNTHITVEELLEMVS
jgi:hypothetical protein